MPSLPRVEQVASDDGGELRIGAVRKPQAEREREAAVLLVKGLHFARDEQVQRGSCASRRAASLANGGGVGAAGVTSDRPVADVKHARFDIGEEVAEVRLDVAPAGASWQSTETRHEEPDVQVGDREPRSERWWEVALCAESGLNVGLRE
ncbi:hypothetical protein K488DRAFT_83899 [Vararia minispora EC-137]|uniref:Uncharacterized protein n=1 Tax=Vararia minispora EC-137 TaxID=1314806 RepID=A0ACB8QRI5_9AGAM|nr:hypothetical protein K488DRAFT_83899 [Vararia minispora EC-137]